MSPQDESEQRDAQNRQKLQEYLDKVRKAGGVPKEAPKKSPQTADDSEQWDFRSKWEQWKKAFADHIIDRDEPLVLPQVHDDFRLLGVEPEATAEEVRKSFHKLALEHHPDKGGDVEKFQALLAAFDRVYKLKGGV